MDTLQTHVTTWVGGRLRRAEIGRNTAYQHRWRLASLVHAHGQRPINQLGTATIDRWLEAVGHQRPASRRAYWSTANAFLCFLVDTGEIKRNPLDGRRAPREPIAVHRALTAEQVAAVLAVAPDARATAIIALEVGLALRSIEVSRLQVQDWSRQNNTVHITGKGSNERTLPMIRFVGEALDRYLVERPAHYGPLIRCHRSDDGISAAYIGTLMAGWCRQAGVKRCAYDGVSGHAFRHTGITDVLVESRNPRAAKDMAGHSSFAVTERYFAAAGLDELRKAMEGRRYRPGAA